MIKQISISLLIGLGCILSSNTSAHPHEFTYQGSLAESGLPVDGVYDMIFSIYQTPDDVIYVQREFVDDVAVDDGLFTAELDLPVFDGGEYWLQIEVREAMSRGSYEVLSPRQKITATPYAIFAHHVADHDHIGIPRGLYAQGTLTGVEGVATVPNMPARGVAGFAQGPLGIGIYGENTAESGFGIAIQGDTYSEDGYGILGRALNASGDAVGVSGRSQSPGGVGVLGVHVGSGTASGVFGETTTHDGADTSTGANYVNSLPAGVYGRANIFTNALVRYGVVGEAASDGGAGVYATNLGPSSGVAPDLVLGVSGFGDSGDNGIISSDPNDANSDVFIHSMDTVVVRLNQDATDDAQSNTSRFEVTYTPSGSSIDRIFYINHEGNVFADGGYHCGQSISDAANDLDEAEIAPCLVDDSPADFAEMLPAGSRAEPGDVLVVGEDGELAPSRTAFARNVIGIHSSRPSYLGNAKHKDDEDFVPLAMSGIVPVKASAENGEIKPGDLLTSASIPGHAMRCSDFELCFGRILGKALQPLSRQTGVIDVIVTLN